MAEYFVRWFRYLTSLILVLTLHVISMSQVVNLQHVTTKRSASYVLDYLPLSIIVQSSVMIKTIGINTSLHKISNVILLQVRSSTPPNHHQFLEQKKNNSTLSFHHFNRSSRSFATSLFAFSVNESLDLVKWILSTFQPSKEKNRTEQNRTAYS